MSKTKEPRFLLTDKKQNEAGGVPLQPRWDPISNIYFQTFPNNEILIKPRIEYKIFYDSYLQRLAADKKLLTNEKKKKKETRIGNFNQPDEVSDIKPFSYCCIDNIIHSFFIRFTIVNSNETDLEKEPKLLEDDITLVEVLFEKLTLILKILYENFFKFLKGYLLSNNLAYVLYRDKTTSNVVNYHLVFPEIVIEHDSYQFLLHYLNEAMSSQGRVNGIVFEKLFSYIEFPVSEIANFVPYMVNFYNLSKPLVEGDVRQIFQKSSYEYLIGSYLKMKKANSATAAWLCQYVQKSLEQKSPVSLLLALYRLYSPLPIIEEIETILLKFETKLLPYSERFEHKHCLFKVNVKTSLFIDNHNVANKKQFVVCKDSLSCCLVHQRGEFFQWGKILNRYSEYYTKYSSFAHIIKDNKNIVKIEGGHASNQAALSWIRRILKAKKSISHVLIDLEPSILSEYYNKINESISYLSESLALQPYPLFHLIFHGYVSTPVKYNSLITVVIYSFYNAAKKSLEPFEDNTIIKQVCLFLEQCLNFVAPTFEVTTDTIFFKVIMQTKNVLATVALLSDQLVNEVSENMSEGSLLKYLINEILFNGNVQGNTFPLQTTLFVDNLIANSSKQSITLPDHLSFNFYSTIPDNLENFSIHFQLSLNNYCNMIFDYCRTNEKSKSVFKRFDHVSKIWLLDDDILYTQIQTIYLNYCIKQLFGESDFDQSAKKRVKRDPNLVSQIKTASNSLASFTKYARKSVIEEKSLDCNRYTMLFKDALGEYIIYDFLAQTFTTPLPEHRCSGKHFINLTKPIKQFYDILIITEPLVRLLYKNTKFGELYITSLLKSKDDTECTEWGYAQWHIKYKQILLACIKKVDNTLYMQCRDEATQKNFDCLLAFYIYINQIACHKNDYFLYLTAKLSAIFLKVNYLRQCLFFYGDGKNGKTHLQTIVRQTLNTYASHTSQSIFSQSKSFSDSLRHTIFTGCLITTDELGDINADIFKELVSNGNFEARAMYEKAVDGQVRAHIITAMNNPPTGSLDEAALQRILALPFGAHFTSEGKYPSTIREQVEQSSFPASSSNIESCLKDGYLLVALHMISSMLDRSTGYIKLPPEPYNVLETTTYIRNQCDSFRGFITSSGLVPCEKSVISIATIKRKVQEFCQAKNIKQEKHVLKQLCNEYKDSLFADLMSPLANEQSEFSIEECEFLINSEYKYLFTKNSTLIVELYNKEIVKQIRTKKYPLFKSVSQYDNIFYLRGYGFLSKKAK